MRNQDTVHPKSKYPCQLDLHPAVEKIARELQAVIDKQTVDWTTFAPTAFLPPLLHGVGYLTEARGAEEAHEQAALVAFAAMATADSIDRAIRKRAAVEQRADSRIIMPKPGSFKA